MPIGGEEKRVKTSNQSRRISRKASFLQQLRNGYREKKGRILSFDDISANLKHKSDIPKGLSKSQIQRIFSGENNVPEECFLSLLTKVFGIGKRKAKKHWERLTWLDKEDEFKKNYGLDYIEAYVFSKLSYAPVVDLNKKGLLTVTVGSRHYRDSSLFQFHLSAPLDQKDSLELKDYIVGIRDIHDEEVDLETVKKRLHLEDHHFAIYFRDIFTHEYSRTSVSLGKFRYKPQGSISFYLNIERVKAGISKKEGEEIVEKSFEKLKTIEGLLPYYMGCMSKIVKNHYKLLVDKVEV